MFHMKPANEIFAEQFPQMRERCLSLAADLDRIGRSAGSLEAITTDPRLVELRQAIAILSDGRPDRARRVLEAFSDSTITVK
jgi:hypothetical protein